MDRETPPLKFSDLQSDLGRAARGIELCGEHPELWTGYRPWRKVRSIAQSLGIDPVEAWAGVKFDRSRERKLLTIRPAAGERDTFFSYSLCSAILEPLYRIDQATGGGGPAMLASPTGELGDPKHRERLRIKTLMDEAAESSLIEGAATTRRDAVEMLRAQREPRTHGERMVHNNYAAMQMVKKWYHQPLTPGMLMELQSVLTDGTVEGDISGRFRRPGENVRVVDERTNEDIFRPPPAEDLQSRIEALCRFANHDHTGLTFMHPVVKACILHFMVGYEHPFVDGNGRTARAVFYWFAGKCGYSIFEYIPISEQIRKGYAKYPQAYIDAEVDDSDLTYFILYKLEVIQFALDRLAEHLRWEEEKIARSKAILWKNRSLNLRQRLLLEHALRHPAHEYTVKSHATSNDIELSTSRLDLEGLVALKLMLTSKRGKTIVYHPAHGLAKLVERAEKRRG